MINKDYELYLGCECTDLDHVAHLMYFSPTKEEKGGEDDVIYLCLKAKNYFDRFCPPITYVYCLYDWDSYVRYNFLRRIGIALKYIFNKHYDREAGILDCFDFQTKDLPILDRFISRLVDFDSKIKTLSTPVYWFENDDFKLRIQGERINKHLPWWVGWDLQFKPRYFFARIWHAGRYIFGRHSYEQHFEITREDVPSLRGIIKWVETMNEEEREKEGQASGKG